MLTDYMNNLQSCIQWAEFDQCSDVLNHARERMQQLEAYICQLPLHQQQQAFEQIDELLPMEWPLWMETCRLEETAAQQQYSLH